MEQTNFNSWVEKEGLDEWHKVDKENFVPPPTSTNLVFFTESGSIYRGIYHSRRGFVCYGIGAKELTDVEVVQWRVLKFPKEFQDYLDNMEKEYQESRTDKVVLVKE